MNSAGRACYVERNYWMIDESNFAIFHLDENNSTKKSGTMQAYEYAKKRTIRLKDIWICTKIIFYYNDVNYFFIQSKYCAKIWQKTKICALTNWRMYDTIYREEIYWEEYNFRNAMGEIFAYFLKTREK